jgi:hypothetical protein
VNADRICMHALNLNEIGDCALSMTGIALRVYLEDDVTPDDSMTINKIIGGGIDMDTSCNSDKADKVTLFDTKCRTGGSLANGERFDFTTDDKCEAPVAVPPSSVEVAEYFIFDQVQWNSDIPVGRLIDVTIFYDCAGDCSFQTELQKTFSFRKP